MRTSVDSVCKFVEQCVGGIIWFMMNTNDFSLSINFILRNENNKFVSFNGQTSALRLSIKVV